MDYWILPGLFFLVLGLRLYQIKELVLPAWVDSVHHVLITKVILEKGTVPTTLAPYLDVPFAYYFGFHGISALFSFLSGLQPEKAILILGQVIGACIPVSVYQCAHSFYQDRNKSILAFLLVALVSQMPAYYVTWGRYSLLTGMFILAVVISEFVEININEGKLGDLLLLFLLCIGLTVSHYFSTLLFLLFVGFYLLMSFFTSGKRIFNPVIKSITTILASLIFLAAWLIPAYQVSNYDMNFTVSFPKAGTDWQTVKSYGEYLLQLAGPLRNYVFLFLGFLGILTGIYYKRGRALALLSLFILIASLPFGITLPNIRPDHMVIVLFLPLSITAALFLDHIGHSITKRITAGWIRKLVMAIPIAVLCCWGIWDTRQIVNPATILAKQADIDAIQWIGIHVDSNARFLINSTPWQRSIHRGVDGGYWLLPLTGRFTIPPPVIFSWGDKEITRTINNLASRIATLNACDEILKDVLQTGEFTHIYIKDGIGSLQAEDFDSCDGIKQIYSASGISIYQIDRYNGD